MACDTLVAFLLPAIHKTGSVDLYGSWDNFSAAYPMQKDRQKGHGHWYGCHRFRNIICDGDPTNCSMPRDGGLMMGGTYWYFYKKDGDTDFHDPSQLTTSVCPLLPGQLVNVLTVPDLASSALLTASQPSPSVASVLTMDPKLRDSTPQPPRNCKLHPVAPRKRKLAGISNELWFAKCIGRLHTAVAESLITGFQGTSMFNDSNLVATVLPGRRIRTAVNIPSSTTNLLRGHPEEFTTPKTLILSTILSSSDASAPTAAMRQRPMSVTPAQDRDFENPFLMDSAYLKDSYASKRSQSWNEDLARELQLNDLHSQQLLRSNSAPTPLLGHNGRSSLSRAYRTCSRPCGHSRCDREKTERRNAQFLGEAWIPPPSRQIATLSSQANGGHEEYRNSFVEDSRLPSAIENSLDEGMHPNDDTSHPIQADFWGSAEKPPNLELQLFDTRVPSWDSSKGVECHTFFNPAHDVWTPAATSPSDGVGSLMSPEHFRWTGAMQTDIRTPVSPLRSPAWGSSEIFSNSSDYQRRDIKEQMGPGASFLGFPTIFAFENHTIGVSKTLMPGDVPSFPGRREQEGFESQPAPVRSPPPLPILHGINSHRPKLSLGIPGRSIGDFGDLDYLGAAIM